MIENNLSKRVIAVGDVHGEYEKFCSILSDTKLSDSFLNWIGGDAILVQTGDMIDRGPKSIESVELIRSLQEGAQNAGGRVVRLLGNHEIWLLKGSPLDDDLQKPAELARLFREEISNEKLQAAWTDGTRLFSHAGIRTKLREWFEGGEAAPRNGQFTPERLNRIADAANKKLMKAVANNDYRGPLFYVDRTRGGDDAYGGIFWGDARNLLGSEMAFEMPQVFGHTPTLKPALQIERGRNLINLDCGMVFGYCGYLEITPNGQLIEHTKGVNSREFKSRVLNGRVEP